MKSGGGRRRRRKGKGKDGGEGADEEGGVAMVVVRLGKRGPRIVIRGARRPR